MPAVTVSTTPVSLFAAKGPSRRSWVTIQAPAGSRVWVGTAADIEPGGCLLLDPSDEFACTMFIGGRPAEQEWFAVTESGSVEVAVIEGAGGGVRENSMISITREPVVEGASVPIDVLRYEIDEAETVVRFKTLDGTIFAETPYIIPTEE